MNTINITLNLGRMAIEHQSRGGQHLLQDAKTGDWRIEPMRVVPTPWQRLRASKLLASTYFRMGASLVAGAVVALGANQFVSPRVALPLAVPGDSGPPPPKSISLAPTSYALEPTDLSTLPPAVAVGQVTDPAQSPVPSSLASAPAIVVPPQPTQPPANSPAIQAIAKKEPEQTKAPSIPVRPPVAAMAKLPSPLPETKAAVSAKPNGPANPHDDGKLAVFNEPLQLAKPPPTGPAAAAPVQSVATAAAAGPAVLKAALPSPASPSTPPATPGHAKSSVRMLAVQSSSAIVVTNPSTRLPIVVKVGESLPDGSTLKSIDKGSSTAVNSQGQVLVLQ